jgi:inorganic pyrophosphatase
MKFQSATLSLLALSIPATSAWAPAAAASARPAFFAVSGSQTALFSAVASYSTTVVGESATESFRLQFKEDDAVISPWHDIPLMGDNGGYNMVVEIPKMTKAKMEVATKEESNPIAQDIKKGKLRDYHGPIFWNYGAFRGKTRRMALQCSGVDFYSQRVSSSFFAFSLSPFPPRNDEPNGIKQK